jgi:hypothetical protein
MEDGNLGKGNVIRTYALEVQNRDHGTSLINDTWTVEGLTLLII